MTDGVEFDSYKIVSWKGVTVEFTSPGAKVIIYIYDGLTAKLLQRLQKAMPG